MDSTRAGEGWMLVVTWLLYEKVHSDSLKTTNLRKITKYSDSNI